MTLIKRLQAYSWKDYLKAAGLLGLFIVYGYFLFRHLGFRPFIDWDESIYAEVAKEALRSHHFFSFTLYGVPWFEKPPLMIWLTALGFKLFGVNEFGGRFFVPVFSLGTITLTLLLVKKLRSGYLAMFLTMLSFAVCYHFFFHSFFLEFDIPVGFFILLSLYGFLLALQRPKFFYLFFAGIASGVLTKSVIGLLPVPIALLYSLLSRQWTYLKNKTFWLGAALCAAVVVPWHIWESLKFGWAFWHSYLFYHVLERYATPLEHNGGPFNYYFPILTQNGAFAILTLISSLYFAWRGLKRRAYWLPLVAAVFIFLFFSSAQTKGYGYIVVVYPYLLAMFGITLADLFEKSP
ncbi:MAG: glycosyltransferase family 39 protein, partial [Patescibacteria group bacterium]|nr:glycosyltransferase family 39 protein [Patescibacteria group bacterium]